MTLLFTLAASAVALAAPASAVSDFRLPVERPQQAPPDVQGPVAPDVPASRRAPMPTPSPSASRTEPSSAAAPAPVVVPSGLQTQRPPGAARRTVAPQAQAPAVTAPAETDSLPPVPRAAPSATATAPLPVEQSPAVTAAAPVEERGSWWPWLVAAAAAVLAALITAGWAARRWTQRPAGPVAVPRIERPRVGPAPLPPSASTAGGELLQVTLEPLRLSLTLMNATLAYRLELTNRGPAPLLGIAIGADMIAAHASMSREEQLAGPQAGPGAPGQRIERLEPGETRVVEGEFRLPLPQIVPIRQGNAALMLPLARFRVEAEGAEPQVRTFVVGQPGQGRNLQPFRLDQGPRIYPKLAQHAFA